MPRRMRFAVMRARIEVEDWLRWVPLVRLGLSHALVLDSRRHRRDDPAAVAVSVSRLCAAARLAPHLALRRAIERRISDCLPRLDLHRLDLARLVPGSADRHLRKAALLKRHVDAKEKGVLFVSVESEWTKLLTGCDLAAFAERYDLVVAPSWSPPHSLPLYLMAVAHPSSIFSTISNAEDMDTLPSISPKFVPVPLYASSWVNPEWFPATSTTRDIDILMVANFAKFKRHHVLFAALRTLPRSLRVLLIGQAEGDRTASSIRAEAEAYGVVERFELIVNAPHPLVLESLRRARISLVLSRREGSCVVVAESLFAGTPVGLLENAHVGSRAFINEHTGRLLSHRDLGSQLLHFLAHAAHYAPRAWAERHISCWQSSRVLNELLKHHALDHGQAWTEDLAPLHWRPDPQPANSEDRARLQPAYDDLRTRFGIEVG
jgi:glycosyltransferase involved in cell wall biosynthesis